MEKIDLRVVKTKENITHSFLELLEKKSIEKITVKELCEKARISRNTFYQHYQYKVMHHISFYLFRDYC